MSVRYANTSTEIQKDFEERFEQEGTPQAYKQRRSLIVMRQDGSSVSFYNTKPRTIQDELHPVLPTPRCTCDGCNYALGKRLNKLKERDRTYKFLMGHDEEFSIICTKILAMKPTTSLGATYYLTSEDEQQRAFTGSSNKVTGEATTFQVNYVGRKAPGQT